MGAKAPLKEIKMKLFIVEVAKPAEYNAKTRFVMAFTVMSENAEEAIQIIAKEFNHRVDSLIKCKESEGNWEHKGSYTAKNAEVAEYFTGSQLIADVLNKGK
jgi:hypothetical protein